MLPSKKKKIIIICVAIFFLVILIIGIYFLTKYIKNKDNPHIIDDAYPKDISYMGVAYNYEEGNYVIIPLDQNYDTFDYTIRTFFEVQDPKMIDNKLVLYSDVINKLHYDASKNEFLFYELDSYANKYSTIHLTDDYLVVLTNEHVLEYRKYGDDDFKTIEKVATNGNIAHRHNLIYYIKDEKIIEYDLENDKAKTIYESNASNLDIPLFNDNFLLIYNEEGNYIYNFSNKELLEIDSLINDLYNPFGFYNDGLIIGINEGKEITGFNINNNKLEENSYKIKNDMIVSNSYSINNYELYVETVDDDNKHNYFIYDLKTGNIKKELDRSYLYIIKVNNENKS